MDLFGVLVPNTVLEYFGTLDEIVETTRFREPAFHCVSPLCPMFLPYVKARFSSV